MVHQALDVCAMAPYNACADAAGDDPQRRIRKAGEDHQQRQYDGGCHRADRDIMRDADQDQEHRKRQQRLHREDEQQATKAGGDSLAALEAEIQRILVAQHRADHAQQTAELAADELLADENSNDDW